MKYGIAFLSLALLAGALSVASAQQQPQQQRSTSEQPWLQRLIEVRATVGTDPANDGQRTAAFKACMAGLGHAGGR